MLLGKHALPLQVYLPWHCTHCQGHHGPVLTPPGPKCSGEKGTESTQEGRKQGEEREEGEDDSRGGGAPGEGSWSKRLGFGEGGEVEVEPLLMNTVCNLAIEIDRAARLEVMESVLGALHCFYSLETVGKTSRKTAQWVPQATSQHTFERQWRKRLTPRVLYPVSSKMHALFCLARN